MSEKDGKNEAEWSGKASIRLFPGHRPSRPSHIQERDRQTDRQIDSMGEEGGLIYRDTHTSEVEGRTNWSIN